MLALDLSGRLALVTGGSGALGRDIVRTLARAGADVVVHSYGDAHRAEALAEEARAMGRRALAVQADVTDEASVAGMRDAVHAALGAPDIVVANAVVQYAWTTVLDQSLADYESQFRSCVVQSVLLAKAFVPAMAERGRVVGVNTECAMQAAATQSGPMRLASGGWTASSACSPARSGRAT